jgi:predicted dehydrogenase
VKRILLPLSKSSKVEIVGIASRSKEKAQKLADLWHIPWAYDSYEALLEDPVIEAVYIPLPNHMHLEWIKKAADAGKHILCEKPFTLNAEEAEEAIRYVEGKGLKIMEAFMYRFHPKWERVRELVRYNEIGRVMTVHSMFTYTNLDPANIRNIQAYGGGALMDIGCYAVSSICEVVGRGPSRVMGVMELHPDFGTDLLTSGILDFGTSRGLFTVSTGSFAQQEVVIVGTDGVITVRVPFNDFNDVKGELVVRNVLGARTVEFEPVNQYQLMFEHFADAIREDFPPRVTLSESQTNMRVLDALRQSASGKGWIKLPK